MIRTPPLFQKFVEMESETIFRILKKKNHTRGVTGTWWLIPRLVSGLTLLIPCNSLGWDEPPSIS